MTAVEHKKLVGKRRDGYQTENLHEYPEQRFKSLTFYRGGNSPQEDFDERGYENGYDYYEKQKSRAASVVIGRAFLNVLDCKGQFPFEAVDSLMLRAVVHKNAFHLLHTGDRKEINDEYRDFHKPFYEISPEKHSSRAFYERVARKAFPDLSEIRARNGSAAEIKDNPRKKIRYEYKKNDRKNESEDYSEKARGSDFGFVDLFLVARPDSRGLHHIAHSVLHTVHEVKESPDERNFSRARRLSESFGFDDYISLGIADRHSDGSRFSAHHNSFYESLTAYFRFSQIYSSQKHV